MLLNIKTVFDVVMGIFLGVLLLRKVLVGTNGRAYPTTFHVFPGVAKGHEQLFRKAPFEKLVILLTCGVLTGAMISVIVCKLFMQTQWWMPKGINLQ